MEMLWIDAAEFEEYGGFILETQFVREMGQAYLLANGTGEPVRPAATTFAVRNDGMYRFFIRTKNWSPEHSPDGLVLEVDGQKAKHICAQMHRQGWYFEIGGDFMLSAGAHTLRIYDTKGWFGRFSCVVITDDYDFTPSGELTLLKKQRAAAKGLQSSVTEMGHYDLIVVGAGVGGVTAAITAARYGLKTALINNRPKLGGNAAEEADVSLDGSAHRGWHETGVVFEIKNYRHKMHTSWSEAFEKYTSEEKNLDVFSNMLVTDAVTQRGVITDIFAVNTMDLQEYKFSADRFVDGTGDGWLGYYAGAAYRVGREAKFQHGESYAPEDADGNTMSGCATAPAIGLSPSICTYEAEDTGAPVPFEAPAWALKLPEGDALGRTPKELEQGVWWMEMPNDYDDVFESEFVRDEMFRMIVGYFDWLKNSWPDRAKAQNYRLKRLGTYNAKRESRRLIGEYILTENDYVEGKTFSDSVCYCGWNIDVHHVDGIFSGKEGLFTLNKKIPVTPIPFGALYSKNIENLMMVGRCISVTHIGLGPVRVQLTAGTMGQAVATAAYLCKKYAVTPRIVRNAHIDELQQLLLRDGMSIPGISHHDPEDLARQAVISATSFAPNGVPENVTNGQLRKEDEKEYAWISDDPLPQSIMLTFDAPKTVRQVRLTFDFPFEKYRYGYMEQPVPRTLVTDFSLSVLTDDGWREVRTVTGNIHRLVVLDVEPTVAMGVRITIKKTLDCPNAIIPEIRIY